MGNGVHSPPQGRVCVGRDAVATVVTIGRELMENFYFEFFLQPESFTLFS